MYLKYINNFNNLSEKTRLRSTLDSLAGNDRQKPIACRRSVACKANSISAVVPPAPSIFCTFSRMLVESSPFSRKQRSSRESRVFCKPYFSIYVPLYFTSKSREKRIFQNPENPSHLEISESGWIPRNSSIPPFCGSRKSIPLHALNCMSPYRGLNSSTV